MGALESEAMGEHRATYVLSPLIIGTSGGAGEQTEHRLIGCDGGSTDPGPNYLGTSR